MTRYGLVKGGGITKEHIAAYLPGCYQVIGEHVEDGRTIVLIAGEDNAGWTLDGYIIPRLATGMWFCWELVVKEDA